MKNYIGIDLGGTNVRVAKVDDDGNILKDIIKPSLAMQGPEAICSNIISLLKEHDFSNVEGIGIAMPGPVDSVKNVITMATNIPGCEGFPFADIIEKEFNVPVALNNDANVAGLAESIFGSGQGYNTVFYITHSTGIGGGLIIDQKIHSGHNGYSGEVANVIVDPSAIQYPIYSHLNKGCVESIASGTAIGLIGKDALGEKGDSARKIFELAKENNLIALNIVDKMSKDIAICLANIGAIVAPDVFVIGGGCTNSSDLYFDKIRDYYSNFCHKGNKVEIVKAKLKEPGVLGAAMLVKTSL